MPVFRAAVRVVALLLVATCAAPAATDPVYKAMREAGIADSFVVENIELHRDAGVVTLKTGTIGFTPPAMGRDTVAVFVGEGEFTFVPRNPIDKAYMQKLTQHDTVSDTFDRAMLSFTDDTGKEIRADARTRHADARLAAALDSFRKPLRSSRESWPTWLESFLETDMDNIEADLLADLYNPSAPGFFSAYLHGRQHPDLRFHVRPRGAFPAMFTPEEVALINVDPRHPQNGIRYLSHLQNEFDSHTASSEENKQTAEADRYRIEATVPGDNRITAAARIEFHAVTEGDRVIRLFLDPWLRVARVTSDGREVPFIQEGEGQDSSFYVVMPEPMAKGSTHQMAIEYAGVHSGYAAGGGFVEVGAGWYPRIGDCCVFTSLGSHALYDLTLRVPKEYTVVGVGTLAKRWME